MAEETDNRQDHNGPPEAAETGENGAACGEACACHATGAGGKTKLVIGQIVVVIALVLVARALLKGKEATTQNGTDAFSTAQVQGGELQAAETTSVSVGQQEAVVVAAAATGSKSAASSEAGKREATAEETAEADLGQTEAATPSPDGKSAAESAKVQKPKPVACGEWIKSLGDLNRKAMGSDGVFVFLPGKNAEKARDAVPVIEKTAEKIRGRGVSVALFTLEGGSREYANIAMQIPPPGVIAMVKGRGASGVSGDITESKLMQAFVAASSGGGGCGPSSGGCGPSGCP